MKAYDDSKLPTDGPGDGEWLHRGRYLLEEMRRELSSSFEVTVTEPWWEGEARS